MSTQTKIGYVCTEKNKEPLYRRTYISAINLREKIIKIIYWVRRNDEEEEKEK
jgi:hypothetical protein